MTTPSPILTEGRACGDCALCCKLGEITGFKPYNQWCQFCSTRHGCDAYDARPQPCRDFYCHYLTSDIDEAWRPETCGMVVSTYTNPPRLTVSVDPDQPQRWQQQPYLAQILHWSTQGAVTIMVGEHAYAAYADHIEDLGDITADHTLMIIEQQTAAGMRYISKRILRTEEAGEVPTPPPAPSGLA